MDVTQTYRCVLLEDDHPHGVQVALSGGGDVVRLECPPHEFGRFELGAYYRLRLEKIPRHEAPARIADAPDVC